MSKDTISVNMNVYDIPILVEQLEKANKEIKILKEEYVMLQNASDEVEEEKEKEIERLNSIIKEVREYIEKLLREETEITDEDIIDYGMKCQRAYFSDSELGKVLEILDKVGETDVKDKR